jgi:hypothetical protein
MVLLVYLFSRGRQRGFVKLVGKTSNAFKVSA